jgi:hypothetical protein
MTRRGWQWLCIALVAVVYGVSFFLPAFGPIFSSKPLTGWEAFQIVAQVVFLGRPGNGREVALSVLYLFGWLPNPALVAGLFLLAIRRGWPAFIVGLSATACACIWLCTWLPHLELFGGGYYVWLGSMALLAGGGLWVARTNARASRAPERTASERPPARDAEVFAHFQAAPQAPADPKDPRYVPPENRLAPPSAPAP